MSKRQTSLRPSQGGTFRTMRPSDLAHVRAELDRSTTDAACQRCGYCVCNCWGTLRRRLLEHVVGRTDIAKPEPEPLFMLVRGIFDYGRGGYTSWQKVEVEEYEPGKWRNKKPIDFPAPETGASQMTGVKYEASNFDGPSRGIKSFERHLHLLPGDTARIALDIWRD